MTENEKELINLIRENDNYGQALMTATAIILGSVLGTQLNQHYSNNELAATTNANSTTANSAAINATKTKNKVDDSN